MAIDMQNVSSSQIKAIGYDPETGTMRVDFNSGATYEYDGVSEEDFASVAGASSVGAAFNSTIKAGGYSYRKV